ncbi:ATPase [Actinomadura sp. KC216]|uniref:ATP-binding protein n=1 Tax=Actinomadura sp. KC216 TaxID=2530370 RepID=UPI00104E3457|nr:AAA family ATPase [Actinomadura sp. KC216]TDB83479.1 ATPase [Actinomadura sp. KC216]
MTPVLIGRDHPAGVLRAEMDRAAGSHGGLVLIAGEAGIGKTTLVTEAVEEARRQGALVLSGSCWDSGSAPGYWPWVQVIRSLRRSAAPDEWAEVEHATAGGLSVLLGEPGTGDPAEGFRLFDAVTTALVSVSQCRPVVVVLDDLHWADPASLKLLEFAAQHTWFERLLLVGTYRDVEVEPAEHPLRAQMLGLVAKATTVTLTGLDRDAVGALMARTAGREPDGGLVDEVHRRTGGNPFFVEQAARLWRSGGSVTAIAPGVREALRRRLSMLPVAVTRLLTDAAVLGHEFHRQVLAACAAAPVASVDRLLDQASSARLVTSLGGGRFAFAHDLVRETLYESLEEDAARRRHAAVVRAVDAAPALRDKMLVTELARHAHLSGGELEQARAVGLLEAAARDAGDRLAFEEAAGHYRRALERAGRDSVAGLRVALDLGNQLRALGDHDGSRRIFDETVAAARASGGPERLARVAVGLHLYDEDAERSAFKIELLREAHDLLVRTGDGPSAGSGSADHLAKELAVHLGAAAEEAGDDEELSFTLWARYALIWGPDGAVEREALTRVMTEVGRRTGDQMMEYFAGSLRWVALLEQGDPRFLDQYHDFVAMAERNGRPRFSLASMADQSIISGFLGRFAAADELLDQVDAFGSRPLAEWTVMFKHLRWALRLLEGRFDDSDEVHRALNEVAHPFARLLEALTAVQRGDVRAALAHVRQYEGVAEPYPPTVMPMWLRLQAQVAADLRDPELCAKARADLAPFAGLWAVSMCGCDIGGPMSHWTALLDLAEERWDDAVAGFTEARRSADLLRSRPWSIEASSRLAEALLGRGGPGDAEAAAGLLDEAGRVAAEIGMRQVGRRVQELRPSAPSAPAEPAAPAPEAEQVFRFDGQVWTLAFGGRTVHMPDGKGLHDLHTLLERPGVDVPAVRLLSPDGGETVVAAGRMGGDAVLDEEAKARYKRRLALLDEEIDRAAALGDDERAAGYDRERAALLAELRAAAGLAGRTRRLGDQAERARKTVTARIKDTLRKLDRRHPELAAHLRDAVSTGSSCSYRPEREIAWRL